MKQPVKEVPLTIDNLLDMSPQKTTNTANLLGPSFSS